MERIKKGVELAAWRHGYQAGELTVPSLCPYSTGSILRWLGMKAIERRVRNISRLNPQGGWETMTKANRAARAIRRARTRGRRAQGPCSWVSVEPD